MAQETLVLKLSPKEQERLTARLEGQPFEHRSVPHARFQVKGEGVVATLYNSGKLVVQGADPQSFTLRFLDGAPGARPARSSKKRPGNASGELVPPGTVVVGSDEAGKGDYFGPLVVAALRLLPEHREGVVRSGVTDSKKLTDESILRMTGVLEKSFEHAIECLDPPAYNARHAEVGNLNPMLADLHAAAIRRIARPGDVVLVDRFANEKLVAERLASLDVTLIQVPRAERDPAVAAASVLARATFVEAIRSLSDEFAVELHKGAGAPTDRAARRFVALHGREALGRVAKLHFKNTSKIGRG